MSELEKTWAHPAGSPLSHFISAGNEIQREAVLTQAAQLVEAGDGETQCFRTT